MKPGTATVLQIQQNIHGVRQAVINWPAGKTPLPGQYLQAFKLAEPESPTAVSLFPGGLPEPGHPPTRWTTACAVPASWNPSDRLLLRGPLGNGFNIPEGSIRVALAAFGDFTEYLLPIAGKVLAAGGEVALFTDGWFPHLPASIEVNPINGLEDGIRWADYLASCTTLQRVPETRSILRKMGAAPNSEVLVLSPMPCGALAECGVCAIKSGDGKLRWLCEDGPVIPWRDF
ncbi:MAG: hypothetical protein P8Y72_00815 [Anaerolineales bacterium]|jgi:hypothetical protein